MKKLFMFICIFFLVQVSFSQIIDGYTDKQSYRAGETINFYVSGNNTSGIYNQIQLIAVDGSIVYTPGGIPLFIPGFQSMLVQTPTNVDPWKNGFGYSNPVRWQVPTWIKSGVYFLGDAGINVPVIIKGSLTSDIVVVFPTNTANAYTESGGKSLYVSNINSCNGGTAFYNPCNDFYRANTVSFLRPQNFNNIISYGFLQWIKPNTNYSVSVIADIDLENYAEIAQAKLVIVVGHSEYWARKARKNFDQHVDSGKNALILSGNTMWWQVRYENENYQPDNTKLTCYKDVPVLNPSCNCNIPTYPTDQICDPLLKTTNWNDPLLKLSIIGSIGSDVYYGGFGNNVGSYFCTYNGFNGFKVILPSSPLFNGVDTVGTGELADNGVISFADHETDGTIMKNLDPNNNYEIIGGGWSPPSGAWTTITANLNGNFPILDVPALGFHRAEIIAYERTTLPTVFTNGRFNYSTIMAFQKTCSSGKVINVNSSGWCSFYGIGGSPGTTSCNIPINPDVNTIRKMTKNMIDNLMNNTNIFVTPSPNEFLISPGFSNTSYTTCLNGSVTITPCGVSIANGFKIDNKNGMVAKIENCTSCNSSAKINKNEAELNNLNLVSKNYVISPNPNKGIFDVKLKEISSGEIEIFDMLGKIIYKNSFANQKEIKIDIQDKPIGVYIVKVISESQIIKDRIIKN